MKFLRSAHSGLDPATNSDLERSKLWPLASKLPQIIQGQQEVPLRSLSGHQEGS